MSSTSKIVTFVLAALAALGAAGAAQAQARLQCESRDYGYQFCPIGGGVDDAVLVEQRSRSACVQGVSWGWDRRGVWVDRGCEGIFQVRVGPPVAAVLPDRGGAIVTCESRDYRQQLCPLPVAVTRVQLVAQRSQAPCIEGRTWGWRPDGIWVTGGCEADFQVHAAQAPAIVAPQPAQPPIVVAPPGQQLLYCESREYGYSVCPTGPLRVARLVNQRSQAPCIYGQSWGYQNDAIWVDRGCAAEFSLQR
jgi:hypothetical protein